MKNYCKVEFMSLISNVSFARMVVSGFLIECDLLINELNEIKTIISEAVTNSVVHGYESKSDGIITMILEVNEKNFSCEIIDNGVGIENVEEARLPLFSTKLSEERSGLGFTIMEMFSDELFVESSKGNGCKVKCLKKLQSA